jgi:hypothetical protein
MKKLSVFNAFAFILVSSTVSCFPGKPNVYIFNDISECENISFLKYENSILYRYENPSADTYLRKLSYVEYFAARYESNELEFEIFAYVFENSETAMQYFENVTGKLPEGWTQENLNSDIVFRNGVENIVYALSNCQNFASNIWIPESVTSMRQLLNNSPYADGTVHISHNIALGNTDNYIYNSLVNGYIGVTLDPSRILNDY